MDDLQPPTEETDDWTAIYDFVRTIPPSRVMTYGQVAECVTARAFTARQVGAAMHTVPSGVPWQRVIGANGHLPIGKRSPHLKARQIELLITEGVPFLPDGERVNLRQAQWQPPDPADAPQPGLFDE